MTSHDWADLLLHLMPVAFALKTAIFLVLFLILLRQTSSTALGRWIVAMFGCTFLASAVITDLTYYLFLIADPATVNTVAEWVIVIGTVITPLAVAACGIAVVWINYRLNRI